VWQPSASVDNLRQRASILQEIRRFFAERDVLEVETPLLCRHTVTDPHIQSIAANAALEGKRQTFFLQTSPEYAMKRLLAAGSGAIYQIGKAFRQDEAGHLHNPEFTILEWYRPGFDHHDLMAEMDDLLRYILKTPPAQKITYAQLFQDYFNLDPHTTPIEELIAGSAKKQGLEIKHLAKDKDTALQLMFSERIEPQLGKDRPCFVYDYPASQAALARLQPGNPPLAARFEVYLRGVELANGFHELQDAREQRQRFENNRKTRQEASQPDVTIDEQLLAALEHGMPDCAGVALGLDRLVMLASESSCIQKVISFEINRA